MATWVGARNYVAADHPMNRDGDEFFQIRIPFEVWNLDTEQQVSVLVYDRTQQIETDEHLYAFNPNDRVYIYIWNEPYLEDVTYNDEDHGEYLTWNLISWESEWVQGDVMKIIYKTPIQLGLDRFTFTTQAPENLDFDLGLIKAWPNPYFAQNPEEESYFDSRIHFINLPEGARITILNLAGQVVRVLEHGGGQELVWDVRTAHNNQVASGVYIAIVETEYGKQVLKLAVVARKI